VSSDVITRSSMVSVMKDAKSITRINHVLGELRFIRGIKESRKIDRCLRKGG